MNKRRFALFLIYFSCNRLAWLFIWFLQGKRELCAAQARGIQDFGRKKWGMARLAKDERCRRMI